MSRGEFGSHGGQSYGSVGGGYGSPRQVQPPPHVGYQREGNEREEFQNLSDSVSSSIFQINNNTSALERILKQITLGKEKVSLEKIHRIQQGTNKLASDTTLLLRQMSSRCAGAAPFSRQQRVQHERLKEEFRESVSRYYSIQNKIAEQEKLIVRSSKPAGGGPSSDDRFDDDYDSDTSRLIEADQRRQEQEQLSEQITVDESLVYEREERIRQIEGDILDINEIFRDLATMVYEQGDMVDSIEGNIERAHGNVENANVQLQKASKLQKAARKKMCILLLILVLIGGAIALIVVLTKGK